MTATDEPSFLYDPRGLWEFMAKHSHDGTCDHRVKGGTLELIDKSSSGNVYVCRCCGHMVREGYMHMGYIGGK